MAKFFFIGEVGDEGVWLVDVDSKSVERIEEPDFAGSGGGGTGRGTAATGYGL